MVPDVWQRVLTEYANGVLDAEDLWYAVDQFVQAGALPDLRWLPVHPPDLPSPEEAALVREQSTALYDLLQRHAAGAVAADDVSSTAMEILGLSEEDEE